jgi:Ca2+-binding EF-hand superfamily protein
MVEEIDGILNNPKKLQGLARQAFKEVDTDNSGFVELDELKQAMDSISESMGAPRPSMT